MVDSLWGEEFAVDDSIAKTNKILKKIRQPKKEIVSIEKQLHSKTLSLEDRLSIIRERVMAILGKQANNVLVIKTRQEFDDYINNIIKIGEFALDTETNNTLDYINCKLMGACLYVPGMKQAYVPINHVDYKTNERLSWQLTEKDVKEELQKLIDAKVRFIYHNYKFDYQVIKCTCGIEVPAYWDTMVGVKMIDERDKAKLKNQYIEHIDRTQQKYDIENLFDAKFIQYAQVDPDLFALYAATDSMMTYKLQKYQKEVFSYACMKDMYNVFLTLEMPIIKVVADMELRGIALDFDYVARLQTKYHSKVVAIDEQVKEELDKLAPQIQAWKQSDAAQTKMGKKTKLEILETPINLASPKQLAILIYDILGYPEGIDYKQPRGTGANVLKELATTHKFVLGSLLNEKKTLDKLINTFIDAIPECVNKKDNKVHCSFNPLGAETGRFSSSGPNLQNIPSTTKDIRPMFMADKATEAIIALSDTTQFDAWDELETTEGFVKANQLTTNHVLVVDDGGTIKHTNIKQVITLKNKVSLIF